MATVWSFQPLEELGGKTGFVQCDETLAAKLIKSGDVQDPRVGGGALKTITRDRIKKKVVKSRKKKVVESEVVETSEPVNGLDTDVDNLQD